MDIHQISSCAVLSASSNGPWTPAQASAVATSLMACNSTAVGSIFHRSKQACQGRMGERILLNPPTTDRSNQQWRYLAPRHQLTPFLRLRDCSLVGTTAVPPEGRRPALRCRHWRRRSAPAAPATWLRGLSAPPAKRDPSIGEPAHALLHLSSTLRRRAACPRQAPMKPSISALRSGRPLPVRRRRGDIGRGCRGAARGRGRLLERHSRHSVAPRWARLSVALDRADECSVDSHLHPSRNGHAVGLNLDAPCIAGGEVQVQAAQRCAGSDAGPGLSANAGRGSLQGPSSLRQRPHLSARRPVILVQRPPAAASLGRQR